MICVSLGHPNPFVIRRTDAEAADRGNECLLPDGYVLIGERRVHGFMDGEVMEDCGKVVQEFLLV